MTHYQNDEQAQAIQAQLDAAGQHLAMASGIIAQLRLMYAQTDVRARVPQSPAPNGAQEPAPEEAPA